MYVLLRQPSSSQLHVTSSKLKKEFIVLVNTYILDTADVLWRMRAFSHPRPPPPTGARTYLDTVSRSVLQSVNIPRPSLAVSLLMHRAFVGFAMTFIEKVTLSFHSVVLECGFDDVANDSRCFVEAAFLLVCGSVW